VARRCYHARPHDGSKPQRSKAEGYPGWRDCSERPGQGPLALRAILRSPWPLPIPLVLVVLACVRVLNAQFQWDDVGSITQNLAIKDLRSYAAGFLPSLFHSGRPVTELTFAVNYAIGRLDPFSYHVVNVAIHLCAVVLVHFFTRTVLRLAGLWSASRRLERKPTIIDTTGNVMLWVVRLPALPGNFNDERRGIMDLTHSRLHTFSSLRQPFEQCGFRVEQLRGIPAPFPLAPGSGPLEDRALVKISSFLIRVSHGLFSHQVFVAATPLPAFEALLEDSIAASAPRAEAARASQ